jgi:hypothetical protein
MSSVNVTISSSPSAPIDLELGCEPRGLDLNKPVSDTVTPPKAPKRKLFDTARIRIPEAPKKMKTNPKIQVPSPVPEAATLETICNKLTAVINVMNKFNDRLLRVEKSNEKLIESNHTVAKRCKRINENVEACVAHTSDILDNFPYAHDGDTDAECDSSEAEESDN